ncbi:MAG: gliding motility-associated C-terminal domain-containing protein [Chitinophagales bacterium]
MRNFRFTYCFNDTGRFSTQNTYTGFNKDSVETVGYYSLYLNVFTIKPCPPIAMFNSNSDTICKDACVILKDSSQQNATHWQWTFEGSKSSFYSGKSPPDICYDSPGVYPIQLIASNKFGSDTAIKDIHVTSCTDCIQAPSAFTPNSDGINDLLKIYSNCFLDEYKIQIYNRWSNLVFESTDINSTWNGKYKENDCEPDVYSYLVIYKNTLKKKIEYKKGNITLLR